MRGQGRARGSVTITSAAGSSRSIPTPVRWSRSSSAKRRRSVRSPSTNGGVSAYADGAARASSSAAMVVWRESMAGTSDEYGVEAREIHRMPRTLPGQRPLCPEYCVWLAACTTRRHVQRACSPGAPVLSQREVSFPSLRQALVAVRSAGILSSLDPALHGAALPLRRLPSAFRRSDVSRDLLEAPARAPRAGVLAAQRVRGLPPDRARGEGLA